MGLLRPCANLPRIAYSACCSVTKDQEGRRIVLEHRTPNARRLGRFVQDVSVTKPADLHEELSRLSSVPGETILSRQFHIRFHLGGSRAPPSGALFKDPTHQ